MSAVCRWSSSVEPQGWPSPSPDLTMNSYTVVTQSIYYPMGS